VWIQYARKKGIKKPPICGGMYPPVTFELLNSVAGFGQQQGQDKLKRWVGARILFYGKTL